MLSTYDSKNIAPTIIVIFGATGDLMAKKVSPALLHLYSSGQLPRKFNVVGVSRRSYADQDFRDHVMESILEHADVATHKKALPAFMKTLSYVQADFADAAAYGRLSCMLRAIDDEWGMCSNKLFYLAVPPEHYRTIFEALASSQLTLPCSNEEGWTRVIVEKPFGKDQKTAKELDMLLGRLFKEIQIYRIDHYLAKNMTQNILSFRFSNDLFEKTWNNKFIERIEIRLWELAGVEMRGGFYDSVGALRDVGQNHLLQILALITMDHPVKFDAAIIREKRAKTLERLKQLTANEVATMTFRAQYKGYRNVSGVAANSTTETYFKVMAQLSSPRWRGVPISIESGKNLAEKKKEVVVTFKHSEPCLCPSGDHRQNTVTFSIEPEEMIRIDLWVKKPGFLYDVERRSLDFKPGDSTLDMVHDYEKLLMDTIWGDQTLFVSTSEMRAMWRFIDPIVKAWRANANSLEQYEPGTIEPVRAAEEALKI